VKTHRPPHIYLNNQYYFITSVTYQKIDHFNSNLKKNLLKRIIYSVLTQYKYSLDAWVILDNHYHILIKTFQGKYLARVVASIHGKSAIEINKIDKKIGRQIWYQYWDYCIRDEDDYFRHMNYIHHNPIKHGYIQSIENLTYYNFSSYIEYLKEKGEEWIRNCFMNYPIIDFTREEDNL